MKLLFFFFVISLSEICGLFNCVCVCVCMCVYACVLCVLCMLCVCITRIEFRKEMTLRSYVNSPESISFSQWCLHRAIRPRASGPACQWSYPASKQLVRWDFQWALPQREWATGVTLPAQVLMDWSVLPVNKESEKCQFRKTQIQPTRVAHVTSPEDI